MRISLSSAGRLYRAIDTPRSLACFILAKYREWDQLASLRLDPLHYQDARAYRLDALATEYLRKHSQLPTSFDKADEARKKFLEAEQLCARTNALFSRINNSFFEDDVDLRLSAFCGEVKNEIRSVLRGVPVEVFPRFGPGATYDDKGQLTTVADKMISVPTLTKGAECFLELWKHTSWGRSYLSRLEKRGRIKFEDSDRFVTVPKDSRTDRGIAVQPSINVFYQLGVGDSIRQRLARWGIDLKQGQELHRRIACEASITGEYSTIDLSSASDTISSEVVKALLPREWYTLLRSLRTTHTTVKNRRYRLEKFSAMGNGYTFELETLLFSALISVTLRNLNLGHKPGVDFWVYGDDIIVPVAANAAVLSMLRVFGFVPNPRKTFSIGSFRESCGGDFFDGAPVRAHYLKEEPNEPHQLIALANGIARMIDGFKPTDLMRARLRGVWFHILDQIPSNVRRCRGPKTLGDLVIHTCSGWDRRPIRFKDGSLSRDREEVRVWSPVSYRIPWSHWPTWIAYAGALYGMDSRGVAPRANVSGYRTTWVALIERPA